MDRDARLVQLTEERDALLVEVEIRRETGQDQQAAKDALARWDEQNGKELEHLLRRAEREAEKGDDPL